ncbi:mannose-6-phosphate receptor binding domain-containing protein [Pseudoneurospora amorphoporcata]|uniref:Mannose-6-phosphate receptor binding domain-containing protein n=1 Tax=Pseudoneurospora amorphoporcata TaxID=241081 RepID=A0AAN6NKB1_9PEZI|nr:mannose-6-phosphate receptor binding domain-containing protein [Pseudoneurospora amorphoporcata]
MHPPSPSRLIVAICALTGAAHASNAESSSPSLSPTATVTPCVATSTNGAFYDLRPDIAVIPEKDVKLARGTHTKDYLARGYDYGYNITLNICAPVVKGVEDVVGLTSERWSKVGAWYEKGGKVYSLGQESGALTPRGRKLVLQYSQGSPCEAPEDKDDKRKRSRGVVHEGAAYSKYSDDEDEDRDDDQTDSDTDSDRQNSNASKDKIRRKSATISFLCDRSPDSPTAVSFVGTDPDECSYFFEVRSQHACAGAEPHKPGSVGPGGVFAIIFFIALAVYVIGGITYQRTVVKQRGWRQLPNYTLWAGIWSFLKDTFIILTSSCARFLPIRRGYRSLSSTSRGRYGNNDDENRLIDQLDEEWDD